MTEEARKIAYRRARSFIDKKTKKDFIEAKNILEGILDFKDSKKYYDICVIEINKLELERENSKEDLYSKALQMMEDPTTSKVDVAIKYFTELGDYLDSVDKIEECNVIKKKIVKKDIKGIQRIKAAGLFFCGISLCVVVFIICAMLWESC